MKTGITIVLIFIFTQTIYCQNNTLKTHSLPLFEKRAGTYEIKLSEYKLKEKSKFPDNFPLQLGGEYGLGYREDKYGKDKFMFWQIFVDFNLFEKFVFFELEYGEYRSTIHIQEKGGYVSLGLNVKILNENQHKIYMHAALGLAGLAPFLILSTKYLYSFNKYFGASIGARYMLAFDKYACVLAGIQIFTK